MRVLRYTAAIVFLSAIAAFPAGAQQPGRTAPATGGAISGASQGKIAVIYSEAFGADKGINRFIVAVKGVDQEFQPRRTELQGLQKRYEGLVEDIRKQQSVATPESLRGKAEVADKLKTDIERKQQDAQNDYQKRMNEVLAPLYDDIGKALEAYARQNGISLIIDASKVPGLVLPVSDGADITSQFISEYNRSHGTASNR